MPAAFHVLLQTSAEKFIESRIEIFWQDCEIRLYPQHAREDVRNRLPLECLLAGEHFIKHATEREHIAARVDTLAACLFW